jgi:tetratricopeptide (TPR) repeat protein
VAGFAGAGKTALVSELRFPAAADDGRFIGGRFDQTLRAIPYAAFAEAFAQFCYQLLGSTPAELALFRRHVMESLGSNAGLMVEFVPALDAVIGPQPLPPPLPTMESANRFAVTLLGFFHCMVAAERPLVLFLDDLHWADAASLELMRAIMTRAVSRHFLIVCAYRPSELGNDSRLPAAGCCGDTMLDVWRESGNAAVLAFYYVLQAQLALLLGKPVDALTAAELAIPNLSGVGGMTWVPEHHFVRALALASAAREGRLERGDARLRIVEYRDQLAEWASHSPTNYRTKHLLVEAELADLDDQDRGVLLDTYEAAIDAAAHAMHGPDEALANELAANCWLRRGKPHLAVMYLQRALQSTTSSGVPKRKWRYYCAIRRRWWPRCFRCGLLKTSPQVAVAVGCMQWTSSRFSRRHRRWPVNWWRSG